MTTAPAISLSTPEALEAGEHRANVKRLRVVLGLLVLVWLLGGVPVDVLVSTTFHIDFGILIGARLASAFTLIGCLMALRDDSLPTEARLRAIEVIAFGSAALATAALVLSDSSLASAATSQLSCILLAQGTACPRRWQVGLVNLGVTWLSFVAFALFVTPDVLYGAAVALCSLAILVVGGHVTWGLRRHAFPARQIGRYQLKRKLGEGGMGEVWVAWHSGLKRDVALKVLRAGRLSRARESFLAEIEATARLTHPNTVRVLDRGVADGDHWYYAMELVDGTTLKVIVDDDGALPAARAVHIVAQAARSLAEAHALGIVHRDLKPENILVSTVGCECDFAKVCDFGLAQIGSMGFSTQSQRTVSGSVRWAAPEQKSGNEVDARADVFALGAVLYYAVTGKPPCEKTSSPNALARVPDDVKAVIDRCLEHNRELRFPHAGDVARALTLCGVAGRWGL